VRAPVRRRTEGREFDSLREYRPGDDARTIDWKATARRAKTMVRIHRPERDQPVMLVLDCGRHMAGLVEGRRKLDHAVDAALRLAKVSLDEEDLVGVVAFAGEVRAHVPPRKGAAHLRELARALYRVEAALEESDYGGALDLCFRRHHKRTLVVVLTDLVDPETSAVLVRRTLALAPRHLPLVASLYEQLGPRDAGRACRRGERPLGRRRRGWGRRTGNHQRAKARVGRQHHGTSDHHFGPTYPDG